MNEQPKLYIAGIGMITPVGFDTASTAAAVRAGVSGYEASSNFIGEEQPITMARIPPDALKALDIPIDEGYYEKRIIKMAIIALKEALSAYEGDKPIPLILAMPETHPDVTYVETDVFIKNLLAQKDLPLRANQIHCLMAGRAAGMTGLKWVNQYFNEHNADYVLIGGSDSYWVYPRLGVLGEAGRLLAPDNMDGFAPGEGAGFILLTHLPQKAMTFNKQIIAISSPGCAQETGHLTSEEPYRGEGLDAAFKIVLDSQLENSVLTIYSSMNGEQHWTKEYGVAYLRNKKYFREDVTIEHPAEYYGDLGAATAPVLMGLAAFDLMSRKEDGAHLVYSSSDGASRAAVRVERLAQVQGV
jgi:3-oxoacyl-[acyl-carrier-protein] synthase-1